MGKTNNHAVLEASYGLGTYSLGGEEQPCNMLRISGSALTSDVIRKHFEPTPLNSFTPAGWEGTDGKRAETGFVKYVVGEEKALDILSQLIGSLAKDGIHLQRPPQT